MLYCHIHLIPHSEIWDLGFLVIIFLKECFVLYQVILDVSLIILIFLVMSSMYCLMVVACVALSLEKMDYTLLN